MQSQIRFPKVGNYSGVDVIEKTDTHFRYKAIIDNNSDEVLITLAIANEYETVLKEIVESSFQSTVARYQSFSHPNILPIIDSGFTKQMPYSVTPFVGRQTLKNWIGKTQDWREAFRVLIPVADALASMHSEELVHRDLKPENIIVDPMVGVKLTNYSLIDTSEKVKQSFYLTGVGKVSLSHTAPEIWQGLGNHLSDQYSFGVVLYELLTGELPFAGDNIVSLLVLQANKPIKSPSQILPGLPGIIDAFIFKMLAANPSARFASMSDVKGAMKEMMLSPKLNSQTGNTVQPKPKAMPENQDDEYQPTSFADFKDIHKNVEGKLAKDLKKAENEAKAKNGVSGCGTLLLLLLLLLLIIAVVFLVGLTMKGDFFVNLADQIETWIMGNEFLRRFLSQP